MIIDQMKLTVNQIFARLGVNNIVFVRLVTQPVAWAIGINLGTEKCDICLAAHVHKVTISNTIYDTIASRA
jgi:hypothetical protein